MDRDDLARVLCHYTGESGEAMDLVSAEGFKVGLNPCA